MLGVSFDSVEANRAFAEKYCFTYRLLSDTTKAMCVAYGAAGAPPHKYAQRVSYLLGPDGTVLEAYPNVSPATHAAQVLEHLDAHRAGGGAS